MINETQAKRYCSEDISNIENYEQAINDRTQTWDIHHRLEIQGQFYNSASLLKRCRLYYNVPASQLIFLTKSDHMKLHGHRSLSDKTKKKLSNAHKGKKLSKECKQKMSKVRRGKSSGMKGKHLSDKSKQLLSIAKQGRHWYNNGKVCKWTYECPEGFELGRIKK